MNLQEFDKQRTMLVGKLSEKIGVKLDHSDIELYIPSMNHVRIRSIKGIFFSNGEAQDFPPDSSWGGSKRNLPANFKPLPQNEKVQIGTFIVDFDEGFYQQ